MKLLTSLEHKKSLEEEEQKERDKKNEIAQSITENISKLNSILYETENKRNKILAEYKAFRESIEADRENILKEIKALEITRENALIPLIQKEKDLITREESILSRESECIHTEKRIKEDLINISNLTHKLEVTRKDLQEIEVHVKNIESKILSEKKLFEDYRREENKNINQRLHILNQKEEVLKNKESILLQKENALATLFQEQLEIAQDNRNERRHIESQQQTLRVAFEEARKKRII
jgi:hypothetical protein